MPTFAAQKHKFTDLFRIVRTMSTITFDHIPDNNGNVKPEDCFKARVEQIFKLSGKQSMMLNEFAKYYK